VKTPTFGFDNIAVDLHGIVTILLVAIRINTEYWSVVFLSVAGRLKGVAGAV
jgi:hypothetical protein